jgi:hypothetical protein
MTPLMLPSPASIERTRGFAVDSLRRQALQRLYRRRDAVDDLIRSLENYQRASTARHATSLDISVGRKCS